MDIQNGTTKLNGENGQSLSNQTVEQISLDELNLEGFHPVTVEIWEETEEASDRTMSYTSEHWDIVRKMTTKQRNKLIDMLYDGIIPDESELMNL